MRETRSRIRQKRRVLASGLSASTLKLSVANTPCSHSRSGAGISSGKKHATWVRSLWETVVRSTCVGILVIPTTGVIASDFKTRFWQPKPDAQVCPIVFTPLSVDELRDQPVDLTKVVIKSDQFRETAEGKRSFTGNVSVSQGALLLKSQEVHVDGSSKLRFIEGFELYHPEGAASAGHADIDLSNLEETPPLADLDFVLYTPPLQGQVQEIEVSDEVVTAKRIVFSGCHPNQRIWSFGARSTAINRSSDRVTMKGVWFKLGKVPLVYIPYFTFKPRESTLGFNTTRLDYRSDNGVMVKQPIWLAKTPFNLTLEPRWLSKNGAQIGLELKTDTFNLISDWLPEDRNLESEEVATIDDTRWRVKTEFSHSRGPWTASLDYLETSDFRYRHDFEFDTLNNAEFATVNTAGVSFRNQDWRLGILAQQLNSTSRDEVIGQRLPEIDIRWLPQWHRVKAASRLNIGHYDLAQIKGSRQHLQQNIRFDLSPVWAEFLVHATIASTEYELDENERTLPRRRENTGSAYLAVNFDRLTEKALTTISPTLFYINRDVDAASPLPIFDRVNTLLQPRRLFADHQTSSLDQRIEESRLATGVRFVRRSLDTQWQKFNVELGYVQKDAGNQTNSKDGGWVMATSFNVSNDIQIEHTQSFQEDAAFTKQRRTLLVFAPNSNQSIHLGVHKRDASQLDQAEIGLQLPLGAKYDLIAGGHYDWQTEDWLESRVGLNIKGCCFSALFFVQRAQDWNFNNSGFQVRRETRFGVQFRMAGIGQVGGRRIESLLARKRYGSFWGH